MGAAVGDFDGDGLDDLFVTGWRDQRLYRNAGGGRFEDVTERAGVGSDLWSTSAAFADLDGDGDLDLYVAAYLDYDPADRPVLRRSRRPARLLRPRGVRRPARPALPERRRRHGSPTSRSRPGSTGRAAGAWAWSRSTSSATLASTCSWPTTARPAGCSRTKASLEVRGGRPAERGRARRPGRGPGRDGRGDRRRRRRRPARPGREQLPGPLDGRLPGDWGRDLCRLPPTPSAWPGRPDRSWGSAWSWPTFDSDGRLDLHPGQRPRPRPRLDSDSQLRHEAHPAPHGTSAGGWSTPQRTAGPWFARPILSRGVAVGDLDGDGRLDAVVNALGVAGCRCCVTSPKGAGR